MSKLKPKKQVKNGLFFPMVAVLVIILISPFIVMLPTPFKTNNNAFAIPVELFPRKWIMDSFPATFAAIPYFEYTGNTIFITILSIVGQALITPLMTYSLFKIEWKGADIISGFVMAIMMIPITVTVVSLYKIYSKLGLVNTYIPLILSAFFGKAFYVVLVKQFSDDVPNNSVEAAGADDTNHFTYYQEIAVPLCKPVLTTIGIYTSLDAWSDYLCPLIFITKPERYTLSLELRQYLSEHSTDWSRLMAAILVFVFPVIICFAVFQRNFMEEIATSGLEA